MFEEKKVSFYSDGLKLVADLYTPKGLKPREKRGAILLCQGFATARQYNLPDFARHFATEGYVAMIFDHRGFGESDGPSGRLIPLEQIADIRNALTFLQMQPEVETDNIGLCGTSFGGGNAAYAAAIDQRVRCTVAIVSTGCGEKWLRGLRRTWEWLAFVREVEEDSHTRVATGVSRMVDRFHIYVPDPKTLSRAKQTMANDPNFCTSMPLETAQAVMEFHPEEVVNRIAPRPILFISVKDDPLTANELTQELYENAGEPKKWVMIPMSDEHHGIYLSPYREQVLQETTDWFRKYMPSQ